jgi:hypothetical protein
MTHPIECIEFSSMIDRIDIDTLSNWEKSIWKVK